VFLKIVPYFNSLCINFVILHILCVSNTESTVRFLDSITVESMHYWLAQLYMS
jgi:hypothetical protein